MERIKELNRYQKAVLILLAAMLAVFTVLYPMVFSQVGYEYADHILVPYEENGTTVYSGKIRGVEAVITVTGDRTVTMHYGDKVYGPYTAKEDSTAIPEDDDLPGYMTGVEILDRGEVFFRGGVLGSGESLLLFDEDGRFNGMSLLFTQSDGTVVDENGNVIDPMEPKPGTILELMDGPELTRKGEWAAWFCGVFICIVTAVTILFADELFRFKMSFRVQDPEYAEPSEWEIAGRYIEWTALPLMALVVFIAGLVS